LGPVLRSVVSKKFGLELSLLERLTKLDAYKINPKSESSNSEDTEISFASLNAPQSSCVITKLVRNYRSHPKILSIFSSLFYDQELVASAEKSMRESFCDWSVKIYLLVPFFI
jgi:helicase MOV-10